MKVLSPLFVFFIALPLSAHEEIDDFLSMSLEELLQVDITSSTLTPEKLKTVPSAVSVFTHDEIKRMGLDVLGELMNLVPGFQSYRSSGSSLETPFSSRGRRIGSTTAEILIMVDGRRFDSPRSSGSSTLGPTYPLKYIEKVEFIRGPGGAVYGSNAMMGVINITTRSNVDEVSVSYGSNDRKQIYLQSSHKYDSMTVDVFGHIESDNGETFNVQDTFSPSRINTDDPRLIADLNFKLKWENTQLNIQHNQFQVEKFYELNTISNGFNSRDGKVSSISLKHDFSWQAVKSSFWLSYNHVSAIVDSQVTEPGELALFSAPSSNDALFVSAILENYTESRVQWLNDWKINEKSSLQFGVELRQINAPESFAKNNFDLGDLANGNFPVRYYGSLVPTTPIQAKSDRNIIGFYTQYQQQLFDSTYLTLGLRYDDFSDIGSQLSPRLGLVQELNKNHSIKLLYGQAFRAPSESELNLLNNPVILGNPDLKPETVRSWDLIWIGQWSDTSFSLGYYENHFDDSIVQVDIGGNTLQYNNMEQDPTKGVELEVSHELNRHWLLRASYMHINEKPDLAFSEAEQAGSVTINYQQTKWNANLIVSYADKRQMANGNQRISLDSYWLLSGKLQYNFTSQLGAFIQAKNLLDDEYLTPATGSSLTEGVPNRGRELLTGISWKF